MNPRKIGKVLLFTAAGLAILIGLLLLGVKLALDRAPRYQAQIKAWVYRQTGYHIAFAGVSPALRWYGPELTFRRLELRSRDDRRVLARAAGGRVGVDVWQLLRNGKLFALRVELDSPGHRRRSPGPLQVRARIRESCSAARVPRVVGADAQRLARRQPWSYARGSVTLRHWDPELPRLELRAVDLDLTRVIELARREPFGAVCRRCSAAG